MQTSEMLTFTKSILPFAETDSFDRLLIDYINDNPLLKQYYLFDDSLEGIRERILSYNNPRLNRQNLAVTVIKQYLNGGIPSLPKRVEENIALLENPKTFTISTGHQLNIFSGPLYVFYKLISVISLSQSLHRAIPEYKFVPVYWMATEDHDMDEITSVNLFGNNIRWNTPWKGMSGKAPLNDFQLIVNELINAIGSSPFQIELKELLITSYSNSENLADATRKWVNALFGKYGLVIVDGNSPLLKSQFTDVMQDELINRNSAKLIQESTAGLKKDYHLQVNPRDINLFYCGDDFRNRIVSEEKTFNVLNTEIQFSSSGIAEELKNHPEKFSPNVILRPLYQETILPNIVYTGGPAEIAYWLELKSIFNYYNIPMPVLFMRSSALVIDTASASTMKKHSITVKDIFKPLDELLRLVISKDENYSLEHLSKILTDEMDQLANQISALDPTLRSSVDSEKQRMLNSIQTIEQKIIRASKKKNETEVNRIKKLKDRLFPNGKLQEREASVISFLVNKGPEFTDALLKNLNPLEKQFVILEEQSE